MASRSPFSAPRASERDRRARFATVNASRPYSRVRHLDTILAERGVGPVYQPIVMMDNREVVAFEALARGPKGTPLERPDLLFDTARETGLVSELDWICRSNAMNTAMQADFGSSLTLFVNVEPDVAATRAPEDVTRTMRNAERKLRVILEVTERALLRRPAELLHWLSYARERWWGVALDDVGATAESLALLPFVRPDVVKLDAHLVRDVHGPEDHRVLASIANYAKRTGATVLAEGIETQEDFDRARGELGATLGQGWFFGRPGPLPSPVPQPRRVVPFIQQPARSAQSPWYEVSKVSAVHTLPATEVRRQFTEVEHAAWTHDDPPVVLLNLPPGDGPWGTLEQRSDLLDQRICFAGILGKGLPRKLGHNWQTSPLGVDEEMTNEWVLVVLGPHDAEVIVAFDADETDSSGRRLLEVTRTTDRTTVAAVGDLLIRQLAVAKVDLDGRLT